MNTKFQTITPEIAARYLASNNDGTFKNRPISKAKVQQFAKDIARGSWQVTHQGIGLYYDKSKKCYVLVDGQHRLTAILATGLAAEMMVTCYDTREQALKAIAAVDVGTVRSTAHISSMVGICSDRARARASSTRYLIFLETGDDPTKAEVLTRMGEDSGVFDAVHKPQWKTNTTTAALMFCCSVFGREKVAEIARRIDAGEGLSASEAMIQRVIVGMRGGTKAQCITGSMRLIRAVEAHLEGKTLRYIPERPREEYISRLMNK